MFRDTVLLPCYRRGGTASVFPIMARASHKFTTLLMSTCVRYIVLNTHGSLVLPVDGVPWILEIGECDFGGMERAMYGSREWGVAHIT